MNIELTDYLDTTQIRVRRERFDPDQEPDLTAVMDDGPYARDPVTLKRRRDP